MKQLLELALGMWVGLWVLKLAFAIVEWIERKRGKINGSSISKGGGFHF